MMSCGRGMCAWVGGPYALDVDLEVFDRVVVLEADDVLVAAAALPAHVSA